MWIGANALFASLLARSDAWQLPLRDEGPRSPLTPEFDGQVQRALEKWHVPGLAIAVVDGEETFTKGYGIATFPSERVTPQTLFCAASTTKSFTAAAVSLLIDDTANTSSPWSWTTPLSSLIGEDFVMIDGYYTSHITLEDALSHRTGLPPHDSSYTTMGLTVRDVVRGLRHLPLTAQIRSRFQYSNLMFIAVSHAIETFTHAWLGDFLSTRIWKPLGMTSTFFSLHDALAGAQAQNTSLAHGYVWRNNTQSYVIAPWLDAPVLSGAGAVISNVVDYAKWIRCHIGQFPPLSPVAHASLRQARTIVNPAGGPIMSSPDLYSLGWAVVNYRGYSLLWHDGGLPGFGAMIAYLPRQGWGVAMMANTAVTSNLVQQILAFELIDNLIGTLKEERFDWAAQYEAQMALVERLLKDPIKLMYPQARKAKDRMPLTLPIENYTGRYTHPAYGAFNFTLAAKTRIPASYAAYYDRSKDILLSELDWLAKVVVELEHVSGEYFVLYAGSTDAFDRDTGEFLPGEWQASKAEFVLGEDGTVQQLGMLLEAEMGAGKIWFTKQ